MSKSRSRRQKAVRPSNRYDYRVLDPADKGYARVLRHGCIGRTYHGPDGDEHECDYRWTCEECPILRERWAEEDEAARLKHFEEHGLLPFTGDTVELLPVRETDILGNPLPQAPAPTAAPPAPEPTRRAIVLQPVAPENPTSGELPR